MTGGRAGRPRSASSRLAVPVRPTATCPARLPVSWLARTKGTRRIRPQALYGSWQGLGAAAALREGGEQIVGALHDIGVDLGRGQSAEDHQRVLFAAERARLEEHR